MCKRTLSHLCSSFAYVLFVSTEFEEAIESLVAVDVDLYLELSELTSGVDTLNSTLNGVDATVGELDTELTALEVTVSQIDVRLSQLEVSGSFK